MNFPLSFIPKLFIIRQKKFLGKTLGTITCRHKGGSSIPMFIPIINYKYFLYKKLINTAIILKNYLYKKNKFLSLILYLTNSLKGKQTLIIKTYKTTIGDILYSDYNITMKVGSINIIGNLSIGTLINNIESRPKSGSKFSKSAGSYASIMYQTSYYTCIKMSSGQIKFLHKDCIATIGRVDFSDQIYKKNAGYNRKLNIRPSVRGLAMNAVDHPHGGGVGHTSIGLKSSKTPWGKYSLGIKTKSKKNKKFYSIL